MRYLLSLCAMLILATSAEADDFHLLELNTFSMDYAKIASNRDGYYPYDDPGTEYYDTETWDYAVAVNFDLEMAAYRGVRLHWQNRVEGASTDTQFRMVTWDFRWGLQLGDRVEAFFDHTSSHILDEVPEEPRSYGLKNVYGVEITFYRKQ